mmetsp:Transcript_31695/g.62720  ORF Transcript_31695/g.62720 Transcript_31695/m.62720 type:complete len:128 (+) Transcript_31695:641-1024(+)
MFLCARVCALTLVFFSPYLKTLIPCLASLAHLNPSLLSAARRKERRQKESGKSKESIQIGRTLQTENKTKESDDETKRSSVGCGKGRAQRSIDQEGTRRNRGRNLVRPTVFHFFTLIDRQTAGVPFG